DARRAGDTVAQGGAHMSYELPQESSKLPRILGAAGLAVAAAVVAVFSASFVVQAFRGPRTITEQELLAIQEPGSWDNYVRFTPSRPATDSGVRYGKKGNEGTKYVLLPVGDRALFCSARIANNGPEYVGRLGSLGGTEEEAVRRSGGSGNL